MTDARDGGTREVARYVALAALCLAVAVAVTWPAPLTFDSRVVGLPGDNHNNMWNLWWTHEAVLVRGQSPWETDLLYHPQGASLRLHTLSPLNVLLGAPLVGTLPLAAIYNGLIYLHFVLAGCAMAALARGVGLGWQAATVAGLAYTFSPWHVGHAAHVNLAASATLPLTALFALRLAGPEPVRAGLACAATIVVGALFSWYHLVFGATIAGALGLWMLVSTPALRRPRGLAACALPLALPPLALAPLLVPMLAAAKAPQQNTHDALAFSADLLGFVIPGPLSIYGAPFATLWSRMSGNALELTTFLGWGALALGAVGLWGRRAPGQRAPFAILITVGILLSLGPELQVGGVRTGAPMPYVWLAAILPPLAMAGTVIRFSLLATLGLAALVGVAIERGTLRWPRYALPMTIAAAVVVVGEHLAWPFPTTDARVPAMFDIVAADARPLAVLEPTTLEDQSLPMLHQTRHGKPILGGYLARAPQDQLAALRVPVIRQLYLRTRLAQLRAQGASEEEVLFATHLSEVEHAEEMREPFLRRLGVGWVVTSDPFSARLLDQLGYPRVAEEGPRTLFRVD